MPVLRLPHTTLPGPHRADWIDWRRWLAREKCFTADEIIDVEEKPHKFRDEYAEYLSLGGLRR